MVVETVMPFSSAASSPIFSPSTLPTMSTASAAMPRAEADSRASRIGSAATRSAVA